MPHPRMGPPRRYCYSHPLAFGAVEGHRALVVKYFNESTQWLKLIHRWRATQMCWSVQKTDKSIDRVGKGNDYNFSVIRHMDLVDLVTFSLRDDNFCWVVGSASQRLFAIPMGGSFSAQLGDLHRIWSFHLLKARPRQWGTLATSPEGYPMWTPPTGCIMALAQFPCNIMVAYVGSRATSTTRDVCNTLRDVWNLPVLCPYMQKLGDPCREICMG